MGAPGQGMLLNRGPMPQVLAGMTYQHQGMAGPPASLASDPTLFNPPRQQPTIGLPQEQRPSYTPPPVQTVGLNASCKPPQTMEQRPSYTPFPQVTTIQRSPSYTPPPVSVLERKPSFTPVPQPIMQPLQINTMSRPTGVNATLTASIAGLPMRQGSLTMLSGPTISTLPTQQAPIMRLAGASPQQTMQQQQ